jgi:ABC-type phosphate/phosphonate transport system substrate-binding protein
MLAWRLPIVIVFLGGLAAVAPGEPPEPYRVGLTRSLFPQVSEDALPLLASPFKALLRNRAGLAGELCLADDAGALARQLEAGEARLGLFAGFELAWARDRFPDLWPLALAVGRETRPTAVVVVRKDSPVQGLDDLRDRPAVLARDCKEFCRLFAERRLPKTETKLGLSLVAKLVEPSCCANALDDVIDHRITATVVDGGALALYRELKPVRAEWLRVVCRSDPFPAAAVVYRKGALGEAAVQQLVRALTGARQAPPYRDLLRLWRLTGFEPVPADYEEQLARSLAAYPPPDGFPRGRP